jgi:hypothetical protein
MVLSFLDIRIDAYCASLSYIVFPSLLRSPQHFLETRQLIDFRERRNLIRRRRSNNPAMEPAEIIASVNQENAELHAKTQQMEQQLFEMHTLNNAMNIMYQNQAFEIYRAVETVDGLHQHIHFLETYIACIERRSDQGMLACQQTAEFFERENAAEIWSSQQWSQEAAHLSIGTRNIQKAVLTKIEGRQSSEEQTRQLLEKIAKIESNILLKEVQNNELKHILQKKKDRLEKAKITTAALVTARDDLNRTLITTNARLRFKVGRNTRTLDKVQNEKTGLEKKLADAEASLHEHRETEAQLHEAIEKEEKLQNECQVALAEAESLRQTTEFYMREDSTQVKTISSLQREVAILQDAERKSGYGRTINELKMEIARLKLHQAQLEDEVQKKDIIVTKSLTKMVEQAEIAREKKKEAAVTKGHALGMTRALLDSLSQTKTNLAIDVAETVFVMLKDIDSKERSIEAMDKIKGYLARQGNEIFTFAQSVASNGAEVQDLIKDLQQKMPMQVTPKEVDCFIAYVHGLVCTLKDL